MSTRFIVVHYWDAPDGPPTPWVPPCISPSPIPPSILPSSISLSFRPVVTTPWKVNTSNDKRRGLCSVTHPWGPLPDESHLCSSIPAAWIPRGQVWLVAMLLWLLGVLLIGPTSLEGGRGSWAVNLCHW